MPRWSIDFTPGGWPIATQDPTRPTARVFYPQAFARRIAARPPQRGGFAGLGATAEDRVKEMPREMREAAMKAAAVQTGIAIGLNFIPILGQVLSALYGLVLMIAGDHYKKKVKEIIKRVESDLRARQAQAQARVTQAEEQAVQAETPAAMQLAASSDPLTPDGPAAIAAAALVQASTTDGPIEEDADLGPEIVEDGTQPIQGLSGDIFKKVTKTVKKAVSKADDVAKDVRNAVVKAAVVISTEGTRLVGKGALRAAGTVAGRKKARAWRDRERQWDRRFRYAQNRVTKSLVSPSQFAQDAKNALRTATGEQTVVVARRQADKIRDAAYAAIDKDTSDALARIASPAYRAELRFDLARGMRGDPALLSEARYYAQHEADVTASTTAAAASGTAPAAMQPPTKGPDIPGVLLASAWLLI